MEAPRIPVHRQLRAISLAWRHGRLVRRIALGAAATMLVLAATGAWQAWRAHRLATVLDVRVSRLEARRLASLASVRAAEPPDFVAILPAPPTVAEIMQTMQRAAAAEGARVVSLQAEQHPATAAELGHLDLVVSIKAAYPAIVIVLREVLDRYPGATLRQLNLVHNQAATAALPAPGLDAPGASAPTVESEARATLAFWSRPLGVDAVPVGFGSPAAAASASSGVGVASAASATSTSASGAR